ncbi:MAG: ferritin-like domain-containing protein [Roseitalea porphyridii]|uniref:Ferritin-like domain-containing protein n=1 Tax=Roseitalea porphyridii TaxID=1852022 RepID=A0A4P6UZV9_9HYPH|nr:ferritin-like domain-containing protein [Roseitalea porphyridii]QBK29884.1 ferritin-like domain-containing protein [Roseitalea porphyridii]
MSVTDLSDLFEHTLKDIYFAERHIHKSLPKMVEKANSDKLKELFQTHREETANHITRLERVFGTIDKKPAGEECPAIEGIVQEAEELMGEIDDAETLDAALTAAAQAVEHYEITRYGTLITWAKLLGNDEAVKLLGDTLAEEKSADGKLTDIAEDRLNKKAA